LEPPGAARRAFFELMREIARPFTDAFRKALSHLPQVELLWRMHFAIGVVAHTLAGTEHLAAVSGARFDPSEAEATIQRMVAFIAAGMRAPLAASKDRS
jgi:hypothetical protein